MVVKIVSDQSEKQLQQARAEQRLDATLRTCAANFLRVVAGAGRPEDLPQEMLAVLEAVQAMQDAGAGTRVGEVIAETLDVEAASRSWIERQPIDVREAWGRNGDLARIWASERLRKAGLRLAAADLVGQLTQRRSAESELHQGVADYLEARKTKRQSNATLAEGLEGKPRRQNGEVDEGGFTPSSGTSGPSI